MKPDDMLEMIKSAVKSREELQGVVCRFKDGRGLAANPVCAFTLCLGMGKTKLTKSADGLDLTCEKEIKLCLLAPGGAGGKLLYEMACRVGEAVKEALPVSLIEIGEVKCQSTGNNLYSDILIKIEESESSEEVFDLVVSGVKLDGVVSLEVSGDRFEKKGQLLEGYSLSEKSVAEYKLTLKMKEPLFRDKHRFTLEIRHRDRSEIYWECIAVNSKNTYLSSGDTCYCYDLVSYKYEERVKGD